MMTTRRSMIRAGLLGSAILAGAAGVAPMAFAQDAVKIGLILPMTGPFASTGRQIEAAAKLYMAQNGTSVAGKKIELIVKDDTGTPDVTRRLAQELLVNEKVNVVAGFGLTPLAMATVPLATQAKVPMVVMAAGTTVITEASPFVTRTSFTQAQSAATIAQWAVKNNVKKVVTLVADYAPGHDSEKFFADEFTRGGGQVTLALRAPLQNPDFAAFLQRVKDANPEALFVFVPSGMGAVLMKQFVERGMDKSGIKLIGPGDITDDDILNGYGDAALGTITAHLYSAAHPSAKNKAYVEAFTKAANMRPNFMSVGGYDGMHLIYEALKKTGGDTDGVKLMEAMKGMAWESPRGPISIDPATREIVQNIYIRKVEKVGSELFNIEFETFEAVKDPARIKR
jgi:branched-chain amino acid transport system substrate-binding protein